MEREKILVVDDDPAWLATIKTILGSRYQLTLTTEPAEALSLAESSLMTLAIIDQRLPGGMSGAELVGQLREIQQGLRAIILTGYAELDDAVESVKAGAFDYLSKGRPDLARELVMRVEKALAADSHEYRLLELIKRGESAELEFKSSLRWDLRLNKMNRELEGVVVRTVAAFLNAESGGALLIGVDDTGQAVGLRQDYNTLRKQDRDGFENHLLSLLLHAYGKDVSPLISIDFHAVEGKDVCRVAVKPSPRAVFAPDANGVEHLYIRGGNSTRQLSTREAIEYCKLRWK
jgi:ActR/RegA family two-component response regulator